MYNGKMLILREAGTYADGTQTGNYDVPGGRVKPGQRFDESLIREIKEETGLDVKIGKPFSVGEWQPIIKGKPWQIVATFFECFSDTDKVVLSEDHDQFLWIDPKDYNKYSIIKTNIPAHKDFLDLKQL
jgi:8-oxo-dGTP diphosphatase